jgi:DNA-binding transcriptional ArsR family regulator
MKNLWTRRLLRATAVAIVTSLLLTAAAGVAGGDAETPGPEAVTIPSARLGDLGVYTATLEGDWPGGFPVGTPFEAFRFEWRPGHDVRDADGRLTATDEVAAWSRHYTRLERDGVVSTQEHDSNETFLYARGTSTVVARVWDHQIEEPVSTEGPVPGMPTLLPSTGERTMNGTLHWYGLPGYCLVANAFQGTRVDARDPGGFASGPCALYHGGIPDQWTSMRFVGFEPLAGVSAMHLQVVVEGGLNAKAPSRELDLWLVDGLAYPLRVRIHYNETTEVIMTDERIPQFEERGPQTITLDLVAFQPGTTERGPPQEPEPVPLLRMVDRTPWGLDEKGVDHPFPLERAYRLALEDPVFDDLRTFLAQHPDAITTSASFSDFEFDGVRRLSWTLNVQDENVARSVSIDREDFRPLGEQSPLLGQASARYRFSSWQTFVEEGVHAQSAPRQLPTVASAVERWRLHASPEVAAAGPNFWEFEFKCRSPWECSEVVATVEVGRRTFRITSAEPDPAGPGVRSRVESSSSRLVLVNGTADQYWEVQHTHGERTRLLDSAEAPPPQLSPAAGAVAPGLHLPPGTVVAAGAIGLGAGLLYWLWPVLKGTPVLGLFSRLREPELLQNPTRRRILDAVEAQPGIHFKELLRRTGLPNGSLVHHVEQLRRAGLVVARAGNGYTCYFPRGPADGAKAGALKADGARKVLAAVKANPGASGLDVAHRTGLQPSTVAYHVQRLTEAGLLAGRRDGRSVRLHPTADGASTAT